MKYRLLLGAPAFPISGGHCELVEVSEKRVEVIHLVWRKKSAEPVR
jgi:hypothetical protein